MITAGAFLAGAARAGFDFYTGVPCSFLTPLINGVLSSNARYVGAASEGEAVAIAAGAWLAGRRPIVMCQNSGLGNAINPLTSLNAPFRIPALFITTWRGEPGIPDEPQHEMMGRITHDLLRLIETDVQAFPTEDSAIDPAFAAAAAAIDDRRVVSWVLAKGTVADSELDQRPLALPAPGIRKHYETGAIRPARAEALAVFLEDIDPEAAVIATTGKCGRELFTLADRAQHLYQVGSMGGASGMALGVALNSPKRTYVLDGDGAALMKLGSLATIGAYAPRNLVHILLDNGVHDSTGGQATVSAGVDFAAIAIACGYAYAASCDDLTGFRAALAEAQDGPALIHLRIAPGSMTKLGRPTVLPADVALRFRDFLAT